MEDISGHVTGAKPNTPAGILGRSLFALLFFGTLISGLVYVWLWTDSPRIFYTQPTIQNLFFIGYGLALILLVILLWGMLRIPEERIGRFAERLTTIFSHPLVAIVAAILLIEGGMLAGVVASQKLSTIKLPVVFGAWVLIGIIILLIIHWQGLRNGLSKLAPMAVVGLVTVVVLAFGFLLYTVNVDFSERIITGYSLQTFRNPLLATGEEWAQAYWDERNLLETEWTPFVYYRREPYQGEYINIDAQGLRVTENVVTAEDDVPKIFFFGGSSVWGVGSRDALTIPSQVAARLHEAGQDAYVVNFGESGYVSIQDILLFQAQLLKGNVPDVAVFYHGFNDVFSAQQQGYAGLPQNELNRYDDFSAGQDRRDSILRLVPESATLEDVDFSLVVPNSGDAEAIAARYLSHLKLLLSIADGYDVELLIVWHPTIHNKPDRTPHEQGEIDFFEEQAPGFFDLYRAVDGLMMDAIENGEDILWLADLFAGEGGLYFYDKVHVTEAANTIITEALLPEIIARLGQ